MLPAPLRRAPPLVLLLLACAAAAAAASALPARPPDRNLPGPGNASLLPGPVPGADRAAWLQSMLTWRATTRAALRLPATGPSEIVRDFPRTADWATATIVQPQVHLYDRYLYNATLGAFTVDRYLDDLRARYGGIDSVLLWAGYPNLGIDERNQLDLLRLADTQDVARQLRDRGVHVLIGYNPWDSATRREPTNDAVALAANLPLLNVEGFNGDTMAQLPRQFWDATKAQHAADPSTPPLVFEPEGGGYGVEFGLPGLGSFDWDIEGWGYMWHNKTYPGGAHVYDLVPGVDRAKWLTDDGMRLTHVCDRWLKQRSDAILLAFFNGIGYESWENIWGIWNGFNDRDAELLRRVATILRWTSAGNLTRGYARDGWRPHTAEVAHQPAASRVHASKFVAKGDGGWVYTLVNLDTDDACEVRVSPADAVPAGWNAYDLYRGQQVAVDVDAAGGAGVTVCVPGRGVGAVLFAPPTAGKLRTLLTTMAAMVKTPLSQYDTTWHVLKQELVTAAPGGAARTPPSAATTNATMVRVPRVRAYRYAAGDVAIEGDCDAWNDPHHVCCTGKCNIVLTPADNVTGHQNCRCAFPTSVPGKDGRRGVGVQFPWERSGTADGWEGPRRNHNKTMDLGPFLIDKFPVTRAAYSDYLQQTQFCPQDLRGFLAGWERSSTTSSSTETTTFTYPSGTGNLPVTSISLSEARAYCQAVGKRLPQTYEWQLAAQGTDGRLYPWGGHDDPSAYPTPQHPVDGATDRWTGPAPVDAFAGKGDSPYGVSDLVGNVWQWTGSEFHDAHTRRVIVRGTSSYLPLMANVYPAPLMIADWYFAPAFELDKHAYWLLMKPSYDRATTVGFRCVQDVEGGAPPPFYYRQSL